MNKIKSMFFEVCPKSGRIKGIRHFNGILRLLLPLTGLLALIWILIRIIPKPSRINYPCIKSSLPFAANFIFYIITISATAQAFIKSKRNLLAGSYFLAGAFITLSSGAALIAYESLNTEPAKYEKALHPANSPFGTPKGIFPGRVVWIYNPRAVDNNCNPASYGHSWFMAENNYQPSIDSMLSNAIRKITGKQNDTSAWNAIFAFHNSTRGKGAVSYKPGEKVFIKINATSSWSGNFNVTDLSKVNNSYYGISETSPALILSVLRQLVKVVGVAQTDIYLGDPMKHIYKHFYDFIRTNGFPNIHFLDHDGYASREIVVKSTTAIVNFSDKGTVLKSGGVTGTPVYSDNLYKIFEDAEYILNIPMLKGHRYAGITMFAKNHFGSQTTDDATHLHNGLVSPEPEKPTRQGYGLYRVQVDLMGSQVINKKNLIYLCDALWATDFELANPIKWKMTPFNNRYMSSLFISFDPVAIESVGFDFIRSEFLLDRGATTYAQMEGVDDYLHQAADSSNWPAGIKYDPDKSGKSLTSMGVHEHWNNAVDKKYSGNLETGLGIELITSDMTTGVIASNEDSPRGYLVISNYPNPFNPSTTIRFSLPVSGKTSIKIFDLTGKEIESISDDFLEQGIHEFKFDASGLASGVYVCSVKSKDLTATSKLLLLK